MERMVVKGFSHSNASRLTGDPCVAGRSLGKLGKTILQLIVLYMVLGTSAVLGQGDSEINMNPGHSGAWLNTETEGQGFLLDVMPETDLAFLAWFTYDTTLTQSGTCSCFIEYACNRTSVTDQIY